VSFNWSSTFICICVYGYYLRPLLLAEGGKKKRCLASHGWMIDELCGRVGERSGFRRFRRWPGRTENGSLQVKIRTMKLPNAC